MNHVPLNSHEIAHYCRKNEDQNRQETTFVLIQCQKSNKDLLDDSENRTEQECQQPSYVTQSWFRDNVKSDLFSRVESRANFSNRFQEDLLNFDSIIEYFLYERCWKRSLTVVLLPSLLFLFTTFLLLFTIPFRHTQTVPHLYPQGTEQKSE